MFKKLFKTFIATNEGGTFCLPELHVLPATLRRVDSGVDSNENSPRGERGGVAYLAAKVWYAFAAGCNAHTHTHSEAHAALPMKTNKACNVLIGKHWQAKDVRARREEKGEEREGKERKAGRRVKN